MAVANDPLVFQAAPAEVPKYQGFSNLDSTIAEATANTTVVSAVDVLVASMTITPAAGTYLVWFSSTVESSSIVDTMFMSIYSGGVQVAASEREIDSLSLNESVGFCCMAKVTVNGAQAIEGRWRNNAIGTATMHERQLMILRVG